MGGGQADGGKRVAIKVMATPDVAKMLRIAAAEQAARDGGRPNVSAVVAELVTRHWRDLGGPAPPLAPEAPVAMAERGRAA